VRAGRHAAHHHGRAHDRDFTINSLFYNLNEGVVEDFTGKGLDDLRAGVLRTPLPPLQTFLDGARVAGGAATRGRARSAREREEAG
jgi:hypothetical protein